MYQILTIILISFLFTACSFQYEYEYSKPLMGRDIEKKSRWFLSNVDQHKRKWDKQTIDFDNWKLNIDLQNDYMSYEDGLILIIPYYTHHDYKEITTPLKMKLSFFSNNDTLEFDPNKFIIQVEERQCLPIKISELSVNERGKDFHSRYYGKSNCLNAYEHFLDTKKIKSLEPTPLNKINEWQCYILTYDCKTPAPSKYIKLTIKGLKKSKKAHPVPPIVFKSDTWSYTDSAP